MASLSDGTVTFMISSVINTTLMRERERRLSAIPTLLEWRIWLTMATFMMDVLPLKTFQFTTDMRRESQHQILDTGLCRHTSLFLTQCELVHVVVESPIL